MLEAILVDDDVVGPMVPFIFLGGHDSDDQFQFSIEEEDVCLN